MSTAVTIVRVYTSFLLLQVCCFDSTFQSEKAFSTFAPVPGHRPHVAEFIGSVTVTPLNGCIRSATGCRISVGYLEQCTTACGEFKETNQRPINRQSKGLLSFLHA
eukprot:GHVS01048012.1.p2 GENE.GHVS01048012.1~~GHVS01048012.1.p2  ORF type:complete len:106 (-),score=13.16 GHVS01048012.1:293-610(-)